MIHRAVRVPWLVLNSAIVLPLGYAIALAWANLRPESYFSAAHAWEFGVNDIGLALFFGIMTKHLVQETLPGGVLHSWRRALLPVAAAVGGAIVPIAIHLVFLRLVAEPMLMSAWLVTTAIDVAVAFFICTIVFGRHAAMPFLVLMAFASNAIGLAVIALTNPPSIVHAGIGFTVVIAGALGAMLLRRRGVRSFWPYLLGPGVLCWCGLYLANVHPALALLPVVPFMPHAKRDPGLFVNSPPGEHDTLTQFERAWAPIVQAVLLLFGVVNAGVRLHGLEAGTWALPVAVIIGRPIGVVAGALIAVRAGLHPMPRIGTRELVVIGIIGSIGLTMALFFSSAILSTGPLLQQLRIGALGTAAAGVLAVGAGWLLHVGRFSAAHVGTTTPAHAEGSR